MALELGTILPMLLCMFFSRFNIAAIEAVLPLNTISRICFSILYWKLEPVKGPCFPQLLVKISNAASYTTAITDFFLFRTHYLVYYLTFILQCAVVATERKSEKIY